MLSGRALPPRRPAPRTGCQPRYGAAAVDRVRSRARALPEPVRAPASCWRRYRMRWPRSHRNGWNVRRPRFAGDRIGPILARKARAAEGLPARRPPSEAPDRLGKPAVQLARIVAWRPRAGWSSRRSFARWPLASMMLEASKPSHWVGPSPGAPAARIAAWRSKLDRPSWRRPVRWPMPAKASHRFGPSPAAPDRRIAVWRSKVSRLSWRLLGHRPIASQASEQSGASVASRLIVRSPAAFAAWLVARRPRACGPMTPAATRCGRTASADRQTTVPCRSRSHRLQAPPLPPASPPR